MTEPVPSFKSHYRGRFAPSPSGELHFGSLIAAVASYLQAKSQQGDWLVRIEDIDEARTVAGSADSILRTLDSFGFEWDDEVVYQSQRKALYQDYLDQLIADHHVFACDCSRNSLREKSRQLGRPGIYPGSCRNRKLTLSDNVALRCRIADSTLTFHDLIQGQQNIALASAAGDFIIRRRDGFFAYPLVVVIDDAEQVITEVVRGADLLDATAQQIFLQQQLNLVTPEYAHFPVAMHQHGQKLSKSHRSLPVQVDKPVAILIDVLRFLNQTPPDELAEARLAELWNWSIENWQLQNIPATPQITV